MPCCGGPRIDLRRWPSARTPGPVDPASERGPSGRHGRPALIQTLRAPIDKCRPWGASCTAVLRFRAEQHLPAAEAVGVARFCGWHAPCHTGPSRWRTPVPQFLNLMPADSRRSGRIVYRLRHEAAADAWRLTTDVDPVGELFPSRKAGRQAGERLGRAHIARGERAQLFVHHPDDSVDRAYTYGDPDDDRSLRGCFGWLMRACGQAATVLRSAPTVPPCPSGSRLRGSSPHLETGSRTTCRPAAPIGSRARCAGSLIRRG